jgi:hypothetical protein
MLRAFWRARCVLLALAGCGVLQAEPPLLYIPFDGTATPAIQSAEAARTAPSTGPGLTYTEGIRGQAGTITADCRLPSVGNWRAEAGTVAFWIRPQWAGNDSTSRTLFCLYGHDSVPEPWLHNRWSITAQDGRLTATLYGAAAEQRANVTADVHPWRAEEWHHVALTWHGVNSGQADAELALYLDGTPVQRAQGLRLDAGPVSSILDVGRDSDASPDYAEASIDEFYVTAQALSPAEIAAAVARARQPGPEPAAQPAQTGPCPSDWWHGAWRFRCRVTAPLSVAVAGSRPALRLPLTLGADLIALGLDVVPDPASYRLLPCDPDTGAVAADRAPLPVAQDGAALVWLLPEEAAGARAFSAWLYLGAVALDTTTPLWVRARSTAWPLPAPVADVSLADYATTAYGDAWDFDEGDFEAIDQWGNKPEYLRNREVRDGVLSMDVSTDPWFIWGDMWGQVPRSQRPVAIDLRRFPVLRMRIRQSCAAARWDLYGRIGTAPELLHHEFRVVGSDWQTVRIDLARDAGWGGTLSAFRIDPTSEVAEARVEIDWVQLADEVEAVRGALELLGPSEVQPPQRLELAAGNGAVIAGARQAVVCRALDARGQPVVGWPLTLRLESASGGHLVAAPERPSLGDAPDVRRAITAADGTARVMLVAGRRADGPADRLSAEATGSPAQAQQNIGILTGPPHHYRIAPDAPLRLHAAELPLAVTARIEDEAGNALALPARRIAFRAPTGASVDPVEAETDAHGAARTRTVVDPGARWVWRVEAEDSEGLRGASAPLTFLPESPRPDPIRLLPNGYFADSAGRPFVPLGGFYANWVQSETPDGEWRQLRSFTGTTDADKRAWMRFLADCGVTTMRFMLRTHRPNGMEPMDIGGRVNPELFAEAVRYLDLGREFGLRFQLVVHEDYTKPVYVNREPLERFALRHYTAADLAALPPFQRRFLVERNILTPAGERYTDPDAIACQDQYARELVAALLGNPQVFAYELENEMVNCPASWANHAIEVIRGVDPEVLVGVSHGGGGLHTGDPLWWCQNVRLDYYNYHLYPTGTTSAEMDYGAAVDVLARYGRMAGVCFLGESAGDEFSRHPDREVRRWVMRDIIWLALANGNPGVLFWNARGAEVREFRLAREAMAMLDLASFRRARPSIAIAVDHPLDDDKYYRTAQGAKDYAMMGRYAQHYLSLGVDTDVAVGADAAAAYSRRCSLAEFQPPEPVERPFRLSPGWREVLVYLRNAAGIEAWRPPGDDRAGTMYLRTRKTLPLSLTCALPAGQAYEAHVFDLDREALRRVTLEPAATLDLGVTDHDWVLVLKRE